MAPRVANMALAGAVTQPAAASPLTGYLKPRSPRS
jgi:hypothetical protein